MKDKKVLVGVITGSADLSHLFSKGIYRIPIEFEPAQDFEIIAFYESSNIFDFKGKIQYYASVKNVEYVSAKEISKEFDIKDPQHKDYLLYSLGKIMKLEEPIINNEKMRISFYYTTLKKIKESSTINQLFNIPAIEEIVKVMLDELNIDYKREYILRINKEKFYRLDFAIFINNRKIDIECDGEKWHSIKAQRQKDRVRDNDLISFDWEVIRLKEKFIINKKSECIELLKRKLSSSCY